MPAPNKPYRISTAERTASNVRACPGWLDRLSNIMKTRHNEHHGALGYLYAFGRFVSGFVGCAIPGALFVEFSSDNDDRPLLQVWNSSPFVARWVCTSLVRFVIGLARHSLLPVFIVCYGHRGHVWYIWSRSTHDVDDDPPCLSFCRPSLCQYRGRQIFRLRHLPSPSTRLT